MDRTRTALVTGATSGLGRVTAGLLAATPGWRVLLGVRDVARGRQVAATLGPGTGVVELDLASLASVRAAAGEITDRGPLDVLVLNAGVQVRSTGTASADGYELTFAVNHLGNHLLTRLLLPHLAPGGRVVVLSSGTHFGTLRKSGPYPRPRWESPRVLATPRPGSGQVAYATSKLATVYFTRELARRCPDVDAVAVDPGLVPATGLARDYPLWARAVYRTLTPLLERLPGAQTPGQAAAQLAAVVTGPDGTSGRYVERGVEAPSSPESRDPARARELWDVSDELVGLAAR
ncbi:MULTISPECIES: SDR family NAD(P)-dependent oxidoreductase [unclassified Geodermatophilus]